MSSRIIVLKKEGNRLKFRIVNAVKSNLFIRIFVALIILFCLIFPISIILIPELNIGFGFIITLIIFWGTGLFFLRKYLWTYYGGEVFYITGSTVSHFFDYRFYQDGLEKNDYDTLSIGYSFVDKPNEVIEGVPSKFPDNKQFYLGVILDGHPILSFLTVTCQDIKELSRLLK